MWVEPDFDLIWYESLLRRCQESGPRIGSPTLRSRIGARLISTPTPPRIPINMHTIFVLAAGTQTHILTSLGDCNHDNLRRAMS